MNLKSILKAIYREDTAKLAAGLSPGNVNLRDDDGRTPLMHAVLAEHPRPETMKLLVARGADVNAADHSGWTALHFAGQDQKAEAVRTLLEAGAAADPRDEDGTTPLWRTLMSGASAEVLRLLLEAGADPSAEDKWGSSSPLSLAEEMGDERTISLLRKFSGKSFGEGGRQDE
ncbi:Pfs, NACHT and Ankyrin domain protein [Methylocaldum marinum]|uniref:Pfs, NACHT and Ankyrin domain protein n=1 Tax=Methylocaldum marinum TaxID=1432792 RepID=A0A250KX87_9GAMM|nr:ankyrin repeat domain-containing protein [Methylocaldum marinum]BBA36212.1 Pfs, NACHT and Ankyrin domain protein [Methylocaldum marinum]